MDGLAYVESIERDGTALAEAAGAGLDRPVPGCPGWSMRDLVQHVLEVHSFWTQVVERRLRSYEEAERPDQSADAELIDGYRNGLDRLIAVLRATDPATEVWTWSPQQDAGWIRRRMAHETAVHRWDAQEAAGRAEPIDPAIAADGVDEFLEFFLETSPERLAGGDASLHLHSTAPEAEWTIRIADGELVVDRAHAKADAAIRAPASDLVLALWRRIPFTQLERFGDDLTIERFLSLADRD